MEGRISMVANNFCLGEFHFGRETNGTHTKADAAISGRARAATSGRAGAMTVLPRCPLTILFSWEMSIWVQLGVIRTLALQTLCQEELQIHVVWGQQNMEDGCWTWRHACGWENSRISMCGCTSALCEEWVGSSSE